MNDQFDDLLYSAGLTAQGCWDELDEYARDAILRFGRLIVQDCIKIIHQQDHMPEGFLYPKAAHTHEIAIKQYFGLNNA